MLYIRKKEKDIWLRPYKIHTDFFANTWHQLFNRQTFVHSNRLDTIIKESNLEGPHFVAKFNIVLHRVATKWAWVKITTGNMTTLSFTYPVPKQIVLQFSFRVKPLAHLSTLFIFKWKEAIVGYCDNTKMRCFTTKNATNKRVHQNYLW